MQIAMVISTILCVTVACADSSNPREETGCDGCERCQDQIWEISTRALGTCQDLTQVRTESFCFRQFDRNQGWSCRTAEDFFASDDPCALTTVYVHGNRMTRSSAIQRGMDWYGYISRCGQCKQPIRLVIWSWNSDAIHPISDDIRVKAARTETQAYLLAQFLTEIDPEVRVSLLGYSFGARVIGGTLHLLGGGELCGRSLPPGKAQSIAPIRVVMWAAALKSEWLLPGHHNGQALNVVDQILITCNCKDPVLKRHWLIDGNPNSTALGNTGMDCSNQLGDLRSLIKQINVTDTVGFHHRWVDYARDAEIRACTCRYALWR